MAEAPTDFKGRVLRQLAEERSLLGHGRAMLVDHQLGKGTGYLGRLLRGEIRLGCADVSFLAQGWMP